LRSTALSTVNTTEKTLIRNLGLESRFADNIAGSSQINIQLRSELDAENIVEESTANDNQISEPLKLSDTTHTTESITNATGRGTIGSPGNLSATTTIATPEKLEDS